RPEWYSYPPGQRSLIARGIPVSIFTAMILILATSRVSNAFTRIGLPTIIVPLSPTVVIKCVHSISCAAAFIRPWSMLKDHRKHILL
ncbi:hypothetical protein R3P38DRAFT_3028275, partial [Favolaschia claudopus]